MSAPKPSLCVDIDNVLCDSDTTMRRVIAELTGGRVCLRYEDIRFFDYCRCEDTDGNRLTKDEWHSAHDAFSSSKNISALAPLPGAFEMMERLAERYMIHFVTSRLPAAQTATAGWLGSRVGDYNHDLHFVAHGEKHAALGDFAAAIDDSLEQCVGFARSGVPAMVLAHPWNTVEHVAPGFPLQRLPDWLAIAGALLVGDLTRPGNAEIA